MSEIVGNTKGRRVLSREWWIVIALVSALVIGFGLTGAKAAFANGDELPTQSIDCSTIGADYHRPLRNGDHINVEIKQSNGSTGQVNVSVEQNIAGGASYNGQNNLGLRISILGSIVEETPLTLDQVMSGIITFNYAAYLKDRGVTQWTVTFVQTNSNDSWPNVECGETPPQPSPSPTPTETPSPTPTPTPTETPAPSPTPTETPKPTPTPTTTVTPTPKPTETPKPTPSPTKTPSPEPTTSPSPSPSPTKTPSPEPTHTPAPSPTPTETPKPTPTPTTTVTPTPKPTETPKPTPSPTDSSSPEPTQTSNPSPEPTNSATPVPPAAPKPPTSGGLAATGAGVSSALGFWAMVAVGLGVAMSILSRRRRAASK